jgi:hypothetical protein
VIDDIDHNNDVSPVDIREELTGTRRVRGPLYQAGKAGAINQVREKFFATPTQGDGM